MSSANVSDVALAKAIALKQLDTIHERIVECQKVTKPSPPASEPGSAGEPPREKGLTYEKFEKMLVMVDGSRDKLKAVNDGEASAFEKQMNELCGSLTDWMKQIDEAQSKDDEKMNQLGEALAKAFK